MNKIRCLERSVMLILGIIILFLLNLINFTLPFISEFNITFIIPILMGVVFCKTIPLFFMVFSMQLATEDEFKKIDNIVFSSLIINELFLSLVITFYFNYIIVSAIIIINAISFALVFMPKHL